MSTPMKAADFGNTSGVVGNVSTKLTEVGVVVDGRAAICVEVDANCAVVVGNIVVVVVVAAAVVVVIRGGHI